MPRFFWLFLLALAFPPAAPGAEEGGGDLIYVFILSRRHGIRSPLLSNARLAQFSADAWPAWEVAPGILTPHGRRQMELLGGFYQARYAALGLWRKGGGGITFRTDNMERSIASAEALAAGLTRGSAPPIHLPPGPGPDPLLNVKPGRATMPADPATGDQGTALADLSRLLGRPVEHAALPSILTLAEAVMLEYSDGKPLAEIAWGRFSAADIGPLNTLIALGFLPSRTGDRPRLDGSNLANCLLATLDQAASGRAVAGALGVPGDRMAVVMGHDSNIVSLSALLGAHWRVPGAAADVPLPGGALVFELRRTRNDERVLVRTEYLSQTYEQIREGRAPDPETAPGRDVPLDRFTARLRAALRPSRSGSGDGLRGW